MPNGQHEITVRANKDQLVVERDQADKVLVILEQIQVTWNGVEKSKALDLALVTLDEVPRAYISPDDGEPDLDRLLKDLRTKYKKQTGKDLTIGKDRIVGSLVGSPYTGGGEGLPTVIYTASGKTPYTGGALQGGIQSAPLKGTLPKRTGPPAERITVGILDTRLFAHPDLAGRYLASRNTLATETPEMPPDQEAHATFIAGVVLERAPNVNLVVDHVLNENDIATSSWKVATKMVRFADAGAKVLNISFGAATADGKPPLVLERAAQKLKEREVTIVAAAGNNGPDDTKIWPAALAKNRASNVVAVGAGTAHGATGFQSAEFSPDATWVGLIAPGENVYSTYKSSGYATWSGTSFAAAAVSGAIARLMATGMTAGDAVAWLKDEPRKRQPNEASPIMGDIGPRV